MSLAQTIVDKLVEAGPSARSLIQATMPERQIKMALVKALKPWGDNIRFSRPPGGRERWDSYNPGGQMRFYQATCDLKREFKRAQTSKLDDRIRTAVTNAIEAIGLKTTAVNVDKLTLSDRITYSVRYKIRLRVVVEV